MNDVNANFINEWPQGTRLSLADLLPPSSRQHMISTLPGVAPTSGDASSAASHSSSRPSIRVEQYSGPLSATRSSYPTLDPEDVLEEEESADWCVDLGPALTPMDTFQLWAAIDRGDVDADMRVWREGMECWTPIAEVAELSLALISASSRTPEPVALSSAPPALRAPMPPPARLAESPAEPPFSPYRDEIRTPFETLVSGPQQSGWEKISQKILPTPTRKRASAHFWVALGSAVAATAITAAVISAEPPRVARGADHHAAVSGHEAAPPASPLFAAPPTSTEAAVQRLELEPEPVARTVAPTLPAAVAPLPAHRESAPRAVAPHPRYDERGQHRLRRSGGRQPSRW